MKKRILSMLLLAVIMITMLSACSENGTGTAAKSRISIATGGSGGVFYTLGAGMADICNQNSDSIESVSETTAATDSIESEFWLQMSAIPEFRFNRIRFRNDCCNSRKS